MHAGCFKTAGTQLFQDNIATHSAALAFYSLFSIAPVVMISIALAGFFFGDQASKKEVIATISQVIGPDGAHAVAGIVRSASQHRGSGRWATGLGLAVLFFGASGAFSQMEQSLNAIWHVESAPGKALKIIIRQRLLSFSLILVMGFLLLVSLVLSAAIAGVGVFLGSRMPGGEAIWHVGNFFVSTAVIAALFAAIFKVLPDVRLGWRHVWIGGVSAAILFGLGKFAIGLYLGKSTVASTYGAAGSLVILLLWVYYSSFILYYGAELTRVYATYGGRIVIPKKWARYVPGSKKTA